MGRLGRSSAVPVGGAAVAALVLAGCSALGGGSGEPAVSAETLTPTLTPSPSPTLPAAARKATRTSATAFTKHWFAAYNHATWALTSAELKPLSDPRCVFCNRAMQTVDSLTAAGHRVEGGRITLTGVRVTSGTPTRGMRVEAGYDQLAATVRDTNGATVSTSPAAKGATMLVAVRWTGTQWVVLDVVLLS